MRLTAPRIFALASAGQVFAQTASDHGTFEVSSVRTHQGSLPASGGRVTISGNRLTIEGFGMLGLLLYAYNLKTYQIADINSLDRTVYDVTGVAGEGATPTVDEFKSMLRNLLADRFALRVHREMRELPVYALIVGKKGPRLTESPSDSKARPEYKAVGRNIESFLPATNMEHLAERIRNNAGLDRPVLDKTELAGLFDIRLMYTPEYRMPNGPEGDSSAVSVFTAVQEQLGLKLEARKEMCEVLVIDRVQKPSGN